MVAQMALWYAAYFYGCYKRGKSIHIIFLLLTYSEIGVGECITIINGNPCWECYTEIRITQHGTTEDLFREIA